VIETGAESLRWLGGAAYLAILLLLVPFGAHRLRLIWLRLRRPRRCAPAAWDGPLPVVTVQLPVYNEANVVARLVDAACRLDYPRDRLEIQVLDDSDDETVSIVRERAAHWRRHGVDVQHVRRTERTGFKAGALQNGLRSARGEFLLVLDADFVPPPDLLAELLPPLADPRVGAVQAAWSHLNPDDSWLTRAQALLLDAHFAIEHESRYRAGFFFNFNGSAGLWRRRCLDTAGGWRPDTLTEDLDLSYRAQLAGWRFTYRDEVRVPAELPTRIGALELQQERWAQGGIQTAIKLLPAIWRSRVRLPVRLEATAHLLGHAVHPLTLLLGTALALMGFLAPTGRFLPWWVHVLALVMATVPFVLFYGLAAHLRDVPLRRIPGRVLQAMLLGLGLGIPLAGAVARGLLGTPTPFHRTPKQGAAPASIYQARRRATSDTVRGVLGLTLTGAAANLVVAGMLPAVPFTGLFAAGYLAATRETLRS
jgi:cellulose synthase/poly-beta-1,6-N-acetylglucosamine synthase-like glycosyltransferase